MTRAPLPKRRTEVAIAKLPEERRPYVFARALWPSVYRAIAALARDLPIERRIEMTAAAIVHLGGETGWGQVIYWHNVGNITPAFEWSGPTYASNDSVPIYDEAGNYLRNDLFLSRFRAYGSLWEACADYVAYVKLRAPGAWNTLRADPPAYFSALRRTHYLGGHGESDADLRGAMLAGMRLVIATTRDLQPSPARAAMGLGIVASLAATGAMFALL